MRKTKVICTIGPATETPEILEQLILGGMNVARLNLSHGSQKEHGPKIDAIIRLREKLGKAVAILLDTRGPEVRVGTMRDGGVEIEADTIIELTTENCIGDKKRIPVNYPGLPADIRMCKEILIDDGSIQLEVLAVEKSVIRCKVLNAGIIKTHKGVNVPGAKLTLPVLSDNDMNDIVFGIQRGIDYVAVSFTRRGADIREIRSFLDASGGTDVMIIAKIENSEGVENVKEILEYADGVMVARGDLGVEVSYEQVPFIQKDIIALSLLLGKPAIVATQMLDSMIVNPRPTRAEVSDIYNAVNEECSAIMLSGETAAGKYPLPCLNVMCRTAEYSEDRIDYKTRFFAFREPHKEIVTGAVTNAAVTTAWNIDAGAIIVLTVSGSTAFFISRLRPSIPIIAITPNKKVYYQLALNWGICSFQSEMYDDFEIMLKNAIDITRASGIVENGREVVIVAGIPVGKRGSTNCIRVETI
ncbi:MAG: pyruvate kinase [Spirochaetes bacterium]|jgi:pyruvate kinase|nr:pyruvate kinase [Spirochaetota bacterium]